MFGWMQQLVSRIDDLVAWWEQQLSWIGSKIIFDAIPVTSYIQALAAVIGFIVVTYQVVQLRKNIRGATQDRLYAHYMEVCKMLMLKPHLYKFFYESKSYVKPVNNDEQDVIHEEIEIMSEMILGLMEHAKLQQRNLPKDAWDHCWRAYAYERIRKSVAIKEFFEENRQWYTIALARVFKDYQKQEKRRPRANEG